jgi:hypothetical protein
MSLVTGRDIAILFFSLGFAVLLELPWLLIMHFLMPREVLERYWKPPHFRAIEIALFTNTIYAPMRTVMLMAAIAFPRLGKKRNVVEACRLVPRWYRLTAIAFNVWAITAITGLLVIGFGMLVYFQTIGEIVIRPLGNGTEVATRSAASFATCTATPCIISLLPVVPPSSADWR